MRNWAFATLGAMLFACAEEEPKYAEKVEFVCVMSDVDKEAAAINEGITASRVKSADDADDVVLACRAVFHNRFCAKHEWFYRKYRGWDLVSSAVCRHASVAGQNMCRAHGWESP